MGYPTFGDIRAEIEDELDLESEDFIDQAELINAFNEAVRQCEASVHKLGVEDEYFLSKCKLKLTIGSSDVDFLLDADGNETNIYAFKIRGIVYANGDRVYTIRRMRKQIKFEDALDIITHGTSTDWYQYMIFNNSVDIGPKLFLVPQAKETNTSSEDSFTTMFYIRKANRMVDDNSVCDIPAFESFIKKYVIWKCYKKEGHPNTGDALQDLNSERQLMIETLTDMVPDQDSVIEKDLSMYEQLS